MNKRRLGLLCVVLLHLGFAFADGDLPTYYQAAGLSSNRATLNQNLDEHIDPFTGKLQLHHTDLVWPGNGGFDLTIQRSFNSPAPTFGSASDAQSFNLTPNIGVGWRMFVGGRLNAGGICIESGNQISFETPDGHVQAFMKTTTGDYRSPSHWRAVCQPAGGAQVWAPNGTRYDMLQPIYEWVPGTGTSVRFWYPTQIQDRNGNFANFAYSLHNGYELIDSITTSDGRILTFGYVTLGAVQMLSTLTANGRVWTFIYDPTPVLIQQGTGLGMEFLLSEIKPPSGNSWKYFYSGCPGGQAGACSIYEVLYPEGGQIAYEYASVDFHDGFGSTSVVSKKAVGGIAILGNDTVNVWTFAYAPSAGLGQPDVTTVTTPYGPIVYKHTGFRTVVSGNAWQIGLLNERTTSNLSGAVLQDDTYTWDKQQISPYPEYRGYGWSDPVTYAPMMTGHTIARDGTTYTTALSNFDVYGNPQTITESGQRSHTTTRAYFIDANKWIINFPANESTPGMGSITRDFDAKGNLLHEVRYGVPTWFTYSSVDGSVFSKTDANGNVTSYLDYHRGTARSELRPESVSIDRSVDDNGNLISETDGAGHTYSYAYDPLRRMVQLTKPVGAVTNIAYSGNTLRTATRGAYVESLQTDLMANPYLATKGGITTAYLHDQYSQQTFQSLPGKVTFTDSGVSVVGLQLSRDSLGRVTRLTNDDNSYAQMVYSGNSIIHTDEKGQIWQKFYSGFGNPDQRMLVEMDPIGASGQKNILINRDDFGNILSVNRDTLTRTYHYNGAYYLTSIDDPETGTTTYGRDAVGNMTSRTIGGRTTNYTYDGLNRLTKVTYPDGNIVNITYLGNGRTASITNGVATRSFTYDGNANLISEALTVGGQTFTTTYTYNGNDALATMTYPKTGEVINYSPDALGRPTQATPFITGATFFDSGLTKQITYASGVTSTFTENTRTWPQTETVGKGGTSPVLVQREYGYDVLGNVSVIVDSLDPHQSQQMTYDILNQVTSALGPWGTYAMSYDQAGNITSYGSALTGPMTYTYSNNKLVSTSAGAFSYDSYGNVTADPLHTYQYNDASNLTCANCATSTPIAYTYDGNNRRVTRTVAGVTTYYVNAANGDLIFEYTPSQNIGIEHIYLSGKRIASKTVHF